MTSLLESLNVQVEVSVQDHFSESVESIRGTSCGNISVSTEVATLPSTQTWTGWFKQWLEILQPSISSTQTYELSLRLTDDQEIQSLNTQYRQQSQPTDVLAFAALEVDCPQPADLTFLPVYLGDIVISVETACRQAKEHQNFLQKELAWLAAHGLLHLLDWDHPDEASLRHMLNQQDVLLEATGFTSKIRSIF